VLLDILYTVAIGRLAGSGQGLPQFRVNGKPLRDNDLAEPGETSVTKSNSGKWLILRGLQGGKRPGFGMNHTKGLAYDLQPDKKKLVFC
jgi:hypothetical protein